ncbi:hypothetical protein ACOSQ2_017259 [Xanthoceras sorbifolium]
MPSGDESTLEALKYAACDCHRNFHRKEIYKEIPLSGNCGRRNVMLNPRSATSNTAISNHDSLSNVLDRYGYVQPFKSNCCTNECGFW